MVYPENERQRISDDLKLGKITSDEAIVSMVKAERYRFVNKLPKNARTALNNAVKAGILGHFKKEGILQEMYYLPACKAEATAEREKKAKKSIDIIRSVLG